MNVPKSLHFEKSDKSTVYVRCISKNQTPVLETNQTKTISSFWYEDEHSLQVFYPFTS